MRYKYRNFPCTVGRGDYLWCVSGTDNKGGSGILEWCISKEDAEYMKSMMDTGWLVAVELLK